MHYSRRHSIALSILLAAAACSSEEPIPPVALVSFAADNASVGAGESATLSWSLTNAASVAITADPGGVLSGVSGNSGTITTGPLDVATTYTLSAMGEDGVSTVSSDAIRITVTGLRIASFAASPNPIDGGQSTTLSWTIGGADPSSVTIVSSDEDEGEVYDGTEKSGSVEVTPSNTRTYTIEATSESGTDTDSLEVTVNAFDPVIVDFSAARMEVAFGEFAEIRWETTGADEVQLTLNGVVRRPWNSNGAARGSISLQVDDPMNEFTFEARNAFSTVSETITVRALAIPTISNFTVTPAEYATASVDATATWDTVNTIETELRVDGVTVTDFPATPSGTHTFSVSGGSVTVVLVAKNSVGEGALGRPIAAGFDDAEPNDTSATSIALAGDGVPVRGSLTAGGDVDYYSVMVPAGGRIFADAGYDEANGCLSDTILDLYDTDGIALLGTVDDAPIVTPCARINPAGNGFADQLTGGEYYLAVRTSSVANATSTYELKVQVTPAAQPLMGVLSTTIGNPSWNIVDVQQISVEAGRSNPNPAFAELNGSIDGLFRPQHQLVTYEGLTAIVGPEAPNDRNYDGLLSAEVAIAGYESKTDFTVAEFSSPNAIIVAFVVVPGNGAPISDSYDFAAGRVMPTELFPMNLNAGVTRNAMDWIEPFDMVYPGYHQFQPAVPGDGTSHRVVATIFPDAFAPDPPPPPEGSYLSTFTLTDAQGAGYTIAVPLEVQ